MKKEREWISVHDRLPEEGVRVLVCTEHVMYGRTKYYKCDVTIGEINDGKWKCANFLWNTVYAWKPLPELPEGF